MSTKIPAQTIDGRKVEVSILDGTGEFTADVGGHGFKADTLKALLEKLRRALRTSSTRISIEASLLHQGRVDSWDDGSKKPSAEPVVITGIHGGTGAILMTRANGQKETSRSYRSETIARRLTKDEADTWVELCQALKAANTAKDAFVKKYAIQDPDKFVTEAVAKAAGGDVVGGE
jgi:hypothetical protein